MTTNVYECNESNPYNKVLHHAVRHVTADPHRIRPPPDAEKTRLPPLRPPAVLDLPVVDAPVRLDLRPEPHQKDLVVQRRVAVAFREAAVRRAPSDVCRAQHAPLVAVHA